MRVARRCFSEPENWLDSGTGREGRERGGKDERWNAH